MPTALAPTRSTTTESLTSNVPTRSAPIPSPSPPLAPLAEAGGQPTSVTLVRRISVRLVFVVRMPAKRALVSLTSPRVIPATREESIVTESARSSIPAAYTP
jgi:hypothetical protein